VQIETVQQPILHRHLAASPINPFVTEICFKAAPLIANIFELPNIPSPIDFLD
jgi:hypothetical protein